LEDVKMETQKFAERQFSDDNFKTDETALDQALYDFSEANTAYIEVINLNSLDKSYNFDYTFSVSNYKYGDIDVYFNKLTTYGTDLYDAFDHEVGDRVYLTGYFINDEKTLLCPTIINNLKIDKDIYEINSLYFLNIYEVYMIGTITAIEPPKLAGGELYKSKLIWQEYDTYRRAGNELQDDEIRVYEYIDYETGLNNYGILTIYNDMLIAVVITEQNVSEYVNYISGYMQYIILGSILIMLSLATLLTRLITKPLIQLNSSAEKMAHLDFSEKITVKSHDELGKLSESINMMSSALELTIDDLNIANDKLRTELQTEKQVEQVRRVFIADTSHELKTPLGIVRGYTERIQDKILDKDINPEYLLNCTSIVLDEMRKMDRLILNMNELSKLESVTYRLERSTVDLAWTIGAMVDAFTILTEEKNLTITYNHDQAIPSILADKHRLEQVFSNFLSNAIRYTPENGHITLNLYNEKDHIRFTIENEYDQLDRIDMEKIWDRFYRVDKSRSRALGGSGLGLAIVKIILELHGYEYKGYKTDRSVGFQFKIGLT
ncbi:MAG: ATP-binding protein, partial [Vallitaleaceae bacterium]|nr:ATP-binding protein [Vallitaleaceae bacterium]